MKKHNRFATGAKTNDIKSSLVKIVVNDEPDQWKSPAENEVFLIDEEADFPNIVFELNLSTAKNCRWAWEITWAASTSGARESKKRGRTIRHFSEKGRIDSDEKSWRADLNGKCFGGTLAVRVCIDGQTFKRHVRIIAVNPEERKIREFLATFDEIPGFDKIIKNESRFKQFINADGEPIVSFDGGYGLTQLTNPKPTYNEAWSWKDNIKAGVKLYKRKRREAQHALAGGKNGTRAFTEEQLQLETWCRWNSGAYHVWNEIDKKWIRDPKILGDTQTGNIGWDLTKAENKNKSEDSLHERDKSEFSKPRTSASSWRYSGIVYADHIKND